MRDKHKKGELKNPFRNVRNPFRNVRNPFRNIQWNVPRSTTTPTPARASIELETVSGPAPPTTQPHPQEPTRQPPPSYSPDSYPPPVSEQLPYPPTAPQQEPLPYPTVGFGAGLAYPPPSQFGFTTPPTANPDTKSPPLDVPPVSDGEGLRKGEPPAYDPSWGYPPIY